MKPLEINRILQGQGLKVAHLDETTASAEQAAAVLQVELDQIAKSVLLRSEQGLVVVVLRGSLRVNLEKLHSLRGEKFKLVPRQEVEALTGFPPGGVSPLGHELPVIMDRGLFEFSVIWAAAGSPFHVFEVEPATLQKLSHAEVADVN